MYRQAQTCCETDEEEQEQEQEQEQEKEQETREQERERDEWKKVAEWAKEWRQKEFQEMRERREKAKEEEELKRQEQQKIDQETKGQGQLEQEEEKEAEEKDREQEKIQQGEAEKSRKRAKFELIMKPALELKTKLEKENRLEQEFKRTLLKMDSIIIIENPEKVEVEKKVDSRNLICTEKSNPIVRDAKNIVQVEEKIKTTQKNNPRNEAASQRGKRVEVLLTAAVEKEKVDISSNENWNWSNPNPKNMRGGDSSDFEYKSDDCCPLLSFILPCIFARLK